MLAICRRDLRAYAVTMTGWAFVAFVLVFMGIYIMVYNLNGSYGNFEYVLSELTVVYLIGIPVLTMRCFAEERHAHTDQLLYALPLSSAKIVLGKYLAMICVLAVPTAVACTVPLVLAQLGDVYLPTAYLAIGAFFLLGAALTAIGMFASSLCESQVTAAVTCFTLLLINYLLTSLAGFVPSGVGAAAVLVIILAALAAAGLSALTGSQILSAAVAVLLVGAFAFVALTNPSAVEGLVPDLLSGLSLFDRYSTFVNGILDVGAVVFYLSCIAVFAFLTVHSFEIRRWR